MDFLTIDMVKMHCRIELYDPNPGTPPVHPADTPQKQQHQQLSLW